MYHYFLYRELCLRVEITETNLISSQIQFM